MSNKKVFITGATRGIGRATALSFAKEGFEVGFCFEKNALLAESLREELNAYAPSYSFQCDLSAPDAAFLLGKAVLYKMGSVDVLVNNAGISHYGLVQDVTGNDFDKVMNVNFRAAFFLTNALLPQMIARKDGRIINVSSIWGQTGASCEALYAASKAALIGWTRSLAKELAPSGILVNAVAPGVVDTDMMKRFSKEEVSVMKEEIPLSRFADPEEVAKVIVSLAGDSFSYVTGQVIPVNGGSYT